MKNKVIILLQIATVCVFLGRAWQHLFFDAPFRELLWDPRWMQWFIEHFTPMSWQEYVTHPDGDVWIQRLIKAHGIFYVICALVAAFISQLPQQFRVLLWLGTFSLAFLGLLYLKEYFFHAGQFFEYCLQFGSPVFLCLAIDRNQISSKLVFWMKVATAATFLCHGLYAVGYYPRPGLFLSMTMKILGIQNEAAVVFLNVAGWLDFVVAIGIFLPIKTARAFLSYAAFWGLATSVARVWGNFYWQFPSESLYYWTHEMVMRLPHFLIPLALSLMYFQGKKET
jgi:hypothetical protein